ncbi:MAG: DUF4160 domain-containing protein [Candidatus Cloacimonetes bacterium]|nr:DUF4160 domain-containing protein [Candidatus Cloacimonadota bacterium]
MPELSRFFGMAVSMQPNDTEPPHFHLTYDDQKASIDIESLTVIEGDVEPLAMDIALEWAEIYQVELRQNWKILQNGGRFKRIEPLEKGYFVMEVEKAELRDDFCLYLEFVDGRTGEVSLKKTLQNSRMPAHKDLLDPAIFNTMSLDHGVVCWANGADFSPEFFYMIC